MRFLFLCLFLTGCGTASQATSTQPNASQEQGYKWYVRECSKCHSYYAPNRYTGNQWQTILKRKKNKVSLTATQFAELEHYLVLQARHD